MIRFFIRRIPDFDFQKNVIDGEVKYPGQYVLEAKRETLTSIIEAGGLTERLSLKVQNFLIKE